MSRRVRAVKKSPSFLAALASGARRERVHRTREQLSKAGALFAQLFIAILASLECNYY